MPHIEDGPVCWCNPVFLVACPECEGEDVVCARCGGARVVKGEWAEEGVMPVHFDFEGDE